MDYLLDDVLLLLSVVFAEMIRNIVWTSNMVNYKSKLLTPAIITNRRGYRVAME